MKKPEQEIGGGKTSNGKPHDILGERPDFTERQLGSKTVFSGKIINVLVDEVELPNGEISKREVVRNSGAAVIIPMVNKDTVLLEWQYRYPLGKHIIELPAGKLDAGEKPELAATRELLEETGYRAGKLSRLCSVESSPGFCDEIAVFFLAEELLYEGHPGEDNEFVSVLEVPLHKAMEMVYNGDITDAKTVLGLLLVMNGRK